MRIVGAVLGIRCSALVIVVVIGLGAVVAAFDEGGDANCDGRNGAADVGAMIAVSADAVRLADCPNADDYRARALAAADFEQVIDPIFAANPVGPTPTPRPQIGILDIGPLFGVPGAQTSARFGVTAEVTIGTIHLELEVNPAELSPQGCNLENFEGSLVTLTERSRITVDVRPLAEVALLPVGDFLVCTFDVVAPLAGRYPLSVSGFIEDAEGTRTDVSFTRFFTIQCFLDDHCPPGQICEDSACHGT